MNLYNVIFIPDCMYGWHIIKSQVNILEKKFLRYMFIDKNLDLCLKKY